ncbi:MAG: glycosyltransferase [Candidatus Acidiferrales bacterium]|jgi:glycosyltransferase involved in cell wall biosynthesis
MKRVLHVLVSLERSGMEIMLLNSSAEWRCRGYECDVLATAETIGPVAPQMRECGYGVFHIPFRSKWRYLPRAEFVSQFYRLCGAGYDVVHIHTEAAPSVYAILAKLAGVRRVAVTPHNTFYFRGALRVRKFCERHLIHLLGGRFGMISEGVRKCEWERFRNRGIRIWNWLDTSHFKPPTLEERATARRSFGIGDERLVIVSVGNCNSAKNHDALLRAISLLPAAIDPLYLHVGRERPDFPERQLAAELKIESKVRFLESQSDTLPFLWASDVFVMPSLNEGFPIAALEAVAAGVPLVCSKVEGLSEVAAETRWAILTSTTAESVVEGLAKMAAIELIERRQRALSDSQQVRGRFSVQNGVRSIVEGLYE